MKSFKLTFVDGRVETVEADKWSRTDGKIVLPHDDGAVMYPADSLLMVEEIGVCSMQTHLVDDPIWYQPVPSLAKLAGQRVLMVQRDGSRHHGILLVHMSQGEPLRYAVRVVNKIKKYLTSDAIGMLKPLNGNEAKPELVLNFSNGTVE